MMELSFHKYTKDLLEHQAWGKFEPDGPYKGQRSWTEPQALEKCSEVVETLIDHFRFEIEVEKMTDLAQGKLKEQTFLDVIKVIDAAAEADLGAVVCCSDETGKRTAYHPNRYTQFHKKYSAHEQHQLLEKFQKGLLEEKNWTHISNLNDKNPYLVLNEDPSYAVVSVAADSYKTFCWLENGNTSANESFCLLSLG